MRYKTALLNIVLLVGGSSQVFAAKSMKIVYHHATATAESQTLNGEHLDSKRVADGEPLDIRGAKKVAVWIDDPNPVLFTYKWEDPTYTPSADYAAVLAFAKAIQPIQGLLSGREAGPATTNPFNDAVADLQDLVKAMPEIARLTLDDLQEARRRVALWEIGRIEAVIIDFYEKLHAGNLNEFRRDRNPTQDAVQPSGFTDPFTTTPAPATAPTSQPGATSTPTPVPVPAPPPPATAPAPGAVLAPTDIVSREVSRAFAEEQSIKTMLATARKFAQAVRSVNVPIPLGELSYDVATKATANIFITPVPEFQSISKDSGRAIGKVSIPTQPYWPVRPSFSPAMVYSFVEASEFSTEIRPDGKFQIIQKDSEYRGTNVSAMLTLIPRGWDEPTFGGGFQVGLSPVKDQIGLFAGGFFRMTDLLSLAIGYGYQQVPRLKKGLSIDTPLNAPGDLKTTPDFKGGFYVGINLNLPK